MEEKDILARHDDWLEKERIRESKISVWDFDDSASFLKDEHSRSCDAKEVRERHERAHAAYRATPVQKPAVPQGRNQQVARVIAVIFVIIYAMIMFMFIAF